MSSSCSSIYLTENVAEGKGLIAPKLLPAETLYGGRKCLRGVVRTFAGRTSAVLGTQPARRIVSLLFSPRFFFSPRHACICVYVVEAFFQATNEREALLHQRWIKMWKGDYCCVGLLK